MVKFFAKHMHTHVSLKAEQEHTSTDMQAAAVNVRRCSATLIIVHGQIISGKHCVFTHAGAPLKAAIDLEEWRSKYRMEDPSTDAAFELTNQSNSKTKITSMKARCIKGLGWRKNKVLKAEEKKGWKKIEGNRGKEREAHRREFQASGRPCVRSEWSPIN